MAVTRFTSSPSISVTLLLMLLASTTSDRATWLQCKHPWDGRGRVLELIRDDDVNLLNLEKCNITKLDLNSFNTTVPKLEEIHLSENNLEEIDPAVFVTVSHATWIFLSQNKLRNIPAFGAHSLFPKLDGLYLDNNKISSINDSRIFAACVELRYLYLDFNEIVYISPDVFKPLINLVSLHLTYNKLTSISDSIFQIKSLESLWLHNNLINYVSPNAFSNLRELHLHDNRISFLPPDFASVFSSPPPHEVASSTSFYRNPWQCSCLLELIADMKRAKSGVKYAAWEYKGVRPSCVYSGRACQRHSLSDASAQ